MLAPKEKPWGFKTLAIKRHRLRLLANRLGVRQRSLILRSSPTRSTARARTSTWTSKVIGAAYTMLDGKRHDADDDFFRVRALEAKFKVKDDFVEYVRDVDDTVDKIEKKDITKFQVIDQHDVPGRCAACNRACRCCPASASGASTAVIHIVLTLVPPHRTYGPMTNGVIEPIYCGAWHSAANICTFCPGREYVTFNFSMEQRHIANVDKITPLLERVEAMRLSRRAPR